MTENPDAYMRSHRLDAIFKEVLACLAKHRPEHPLRMTIKALQAAEATANRSPDYLLALVREVFERGDSVDAAAMPGATAGRSNSLGDEVESADAFDPAKLLAPPPGLAAIKMFERQRRGSVSAESYDPAKGASQTPLCIPKTASEKQRLLSIASKNLMMRGLSPENRSPILDAMFECKAKAGEDIIVQGDLGDNFYIVESGLFSIVVEGKGEVTQVGPGGSFGELALMYNQPRQATVRALEDAVVWGLDGATFRKVMIDIAYKKRCLYKDLLKKVALFTTLSSAEVALISEALVPIQYAAGEAVIQQGDLGQEFFIIAEGKTVVTKDGEVVNRLGEGDYFGELALLNQEPRNATVVAETPVKCLTLSRSDFTRLMGPLVPYLQRNSEQYKKYQKYIPATP